MTLSPETQRLIEERMQRDGYPTPDDLVRAALESLNDHEQMLDEETLAAIEEAENEPDSDAIPIEVAFDRLRKKYLSK